MNKKFFFIAALAVIVGAIVFASTAKSEEITTLKTGQNFLDSCSILEHTSDVKTLKQVQVAEFCLGYVYGMAQVMGTLSMDGVNLETISTEYIRYLKRHPKELDQKSELLFLSAIKELWPL